MNDRLHMIRLDVTPDALVRFASSQGITRVDDDGHGYALHAWLAAMFGALAPKPFRLVEMRGGRFMLLAYSARAHPDLLEHAHAFADPAAFAVLGQESVCSKPMPATWRSGLRLRVEVVACPTSRKDDEEKDVYLRELDRLGSAARPREEVYVDWLQRQLVPAAAMANARLEGFSRVLLARRSRGAEGGRRLVSVERPRVQFAAEATIVDGERFEQLLRRGVGRHRAFGFGMLLLRPAT